MGGLPGLGWILWVVLIGALVSAVWAWTSARRGAQRETPLEALQRRLANGEIDVQRYESLKAVLTRDGAGR